MNSLEYLTYTSKYETLNREDFTTQIKINLVTNFTDDILKNILIGICLSNNIYPIIYKTPYRQYHLDLKNTSSELHANNPDVTFLFFDINPFKDSEFRSSQDHFKEILFDIERYCQATAKTVVLSNFILSYQSAYGNLFLHNPFFNLVNEYNQKFKGLAARLPNLTILDTNQLIHFLGESRTFDLRGLYVFDIPFTHEFMTLLADEWFAYIRALIGKSKKCIVVDLDNTLWGGIVGEVGPTNIALGPDYPGNVFLYFQHALLDFYNRGIILAINSKNNPEDVREVFEKNPYMVLKEQHFSAIRINWDDKTDNLIDIAKELNIGTDSIVFLDDDPLTRAIVKDRLPEVNVPYFSVPPEDYIKILYGLNMFHQFSLTEEDKKKGKMYTEEKQRKEVQKTVKNINEYIAELNIVVQVSMDAVSLLPRLSQLTQKTNQFNLTTKRYTESQIKKLIEDGGLVFSANISDKFGNYGTVIMAIIIPDLPNKNDAALDIFLMSCRVMGRGIEYVFMDYLAKNLDMHGFKTLHAVFAPTAKNKPAEAFLSDHGFTAENKKSDNMAKKFSLDISRYTKQPCPKLNKTIKIT
ncbi:MAG: HAD-IIIC family phosphatase [Patescibacteria group bacterium]